MYPEWPELYHSWHDFFLLAGTAAVTLVGLLFVAISLHIDALIVPSREYLLTLARIILMSFVVVMTLSLMMLIPYQRMRPVGFELIVMGLIPLVVTLRQIRAANQGTHHDQFSRRLFRQRLMMPLIGYVGLIATGLAVFLTHEPAMFFPVVGFVCMLLGNAAGSSWDLLVRVARVKRADAEMDQ